MSKNGKQTSTKSYREIIGQPQRRLFLLDREMNIDVDARTCSLSFASDTPIQHWFGTLILDHSPSSVRLDRLQSDGPLLMDHNSRDQIGILENISVGADGKSRAIARFSRSARAREIFDDVQDGIRRSVSVGFVVHDLRLESSTDTEDIYRATDWEPLEASIVSVPADISVGVGRSLETDDSEIRNPISVIRNSEPVRSTMPEELQTPNNDLIQIREIATAMAALGDTRANGLAVDAIASGQTVTEFRTALLSSRRAAQVVIPPEEPTDVAARSGAVPATVNLRHRRLRSFTRENSGPDPVLAAYRAGQFLRSVLYQDAGARRWCREHGVFNALRRDQSESDNESGGYFVVPEVDNVIIDLKEQYGVFRANAEVVPMATNSLVRQRRVGGLTAKPIGAVGAARRMTAGKLTWDRVELNARMWGVFDKLEDELIEDADGIINFADKFVADFAYACSVAEDGAGFNADGTATYHGIVGIIPKMLALSGTIANIAGLVVGTGNLWSELVRGDFTKLVGRLPQFADTPNAAWYMSKVFWGDVVLPIILAAGGVTASEMQGGRQKEFLGYPVRISQVLPKAEANSQVCCLLGDLVQSSMFGDRRGSTIKMTDSNDVDWENNLQSIKGTERFDIVNHSVGNAHATAASRVVGPVVGLITAAS